MNVGIECPFYMCENGSVRSLDIPSFDNTLIAGRRTLTGTALFLLNSCLGLFPAAHADSAI